MATKNPGFEKFDVIVTQLLSIPRRELEKREKLYQERRAKKQQTKS